MTSAPVTPTQLLERLRLSGRIVHERTLTSWRDRSVALMPPLHPIGLGKGKGSVQVWLEPDIFERACIVYDALGRRRVHGYAILCLWFCGFPVPIEKLRTYWLKQLSREIGREVGEPGELPSDKHVGVIEGMVKPMQKTANVDETAARSMARTIIVALQEPFEQPINKDELAELASAIPQFTKDWKLPEGMKFKLGGETLEKLERATRSFVSIDARIKLIESATSEEFTIAQNHLRRLGRFVKSLAMVPGVGPMNEGELISTGRAISISLGSVIFRAFLMLIRAGHGWRLEATARLMDELEELFEPLPRPTETGKSLEMSPNELHKSREKFDEFYNIWKDLDLNWLYHPE